MGKDYKYNGIDSSFSHISSLLSEMASSEVIFLKEEKLRQLADLIRGHEINNMYYTKFCGLDDQLKYITMINDNKKSVITILDNCKGLINRYKDDTVRGPIASDILVYAEHCLNYALQFFRNYTVRKEYLDKMTDHLHQLFHALEDLNTCGEADVAYFKEDVEHYNHRIMSYIRLSANSYASEEFSRYLRNIGIGFHELVRSYQVKLGYSGRFEDMEEGQKLEVYGAIIEASGRLNVLEDGGRKALRVNKKTDIFKYGSKAMFMYNVGSIVWDVYTSEHPLRTTTKAVIVELAKYEGAELGELVGSAIAAELVAAEACAAVVTAVTMLAGVAGGFIFGAIAGALFDLIFGSGGAAVLPTNGFILYAAPMPNGRDIAKQIANI